MEESPMIITLLTAMITPAVLIMACGQLSLTTSQRLSRSIGRTRNLVDELKQINEGKKDVTDEELLTIHIQISKTTQRSVLLQRVMSMLYIALMFFISSSLLIGVFEIMAWVRHWILIAVPMAGAVALFSASILLILETRLAISSVEQEMKFAMMLDKELILRKNAYNTVNSDQKLKVEKTNTG
jgi:hypothetical protein